MLPSSSRHHQLPRNPWVRSLIFWVSCASCMVQARNYMKPRPWSLPQVPQSSKKQVFLDECESFFALLQRLRGGSTNRGDGRGYDSAGRYHQDDNDYRRQRDDDPYNPDEDFYPSRNDRRDGYYDDYDDRGQSSPSRKQPQGDSLLSSMPSIIRNGDRRIGLALLGSGTIITMLGMSLFFNKSLMRMGNLLFIAGVPITIGPSRTIGYFLQKEKIRASACLGVGIILVLLGNPVFGIILEVFGILNLFGNMFPIVLAFAKQMPIVGKILNGDNNSRNQWGQSGSDRRDRDERDADDYYYQDEQRGGNDGRYY